MWPPALFGDAPARFRSRAGRASSSSSIATCTSSPACRPAGGRRSKTQSRRCGPTGPASSDSGRSSQPKRQLRWTSCRSASSAPRAPVTTTRCCLRAATSLTSWRSSVPRRQWPPGRLLTLLLLYQAGYDVGRFVSLERLVQESSKTYYERLGRRGPAGIRTSTTSVPGSSTSLGSSPRPTGSSQVEDMVQLARRLLHAQGRHKAVIPLRLPGAAGKAMAVGALLPRGAGPRGRQTFDPWLTSEDATLGCETQAELAARYTELRPLLNRVAYAVLGSHSDAEDVVSECWLRLIVAHRREPIDRTPFIGPPAVRAGWLLVCVGEPRGCRCVTALG